jgi:outer membrane protein assembly factor BamB
MTGKHFSLICLLTLAMLTGAILAGANAELPTESQADLTALKTPDKHDWPQWGGTSTRNNTPEGRNIPTEWDIKSGTNIKWSMRLGSETYGNPVVAGGKAFVGTNNGAGYVSRYPSNVDLGVLLCFDAEDGKFLWQHQQLARKLHRNRTGTKGAWSRVCGRPNRGPAN